MKAIVCFSGFRQSSYEKSGTLYLFRNVIRKFATPDDLTTYHPRTWKTDVEELTLQLVALEVKDVAVVSYSHGQAAAMELARLAAKYGITISLWLACDPVYRPGWLPRKTWAQPFAFRAMIPRSARIKVPATVKCVRWVRQTTDLPRGHDLVAEVPEATKIHIPILLECGHAEIDNHGYWHEMVRHHLSKWAGRPDLDVWDHKL